MRTEENFLFIYLFLFGEDQAALGGSWVAELGDRAGGRAGWQH